MASQLAAHDYMVKMQQQQQAVAAQSNPQETMSHKIKTGLGLRIRFPQIWLFLMDSDLYPHFQIRIRIRFFNKI